jgi:hypothetical protein
VTGSRSFPTVDAVKRPCLLLQKTSLMRLRNSLFRTSSSLFARVGNFDKKLRNQGPFRRRVAFPGTEIAEIPSIFPVEQGTQGREQFASDCTIHTSVSRFPDSSENRSKSARVRAICDHAWIRRTQRAPLIARIRPNLSARDLPRSVRVAVDSQNLKPVKPRGRFARPSPRQGAQSPSNTAATEQ